MLRPLRRRLVDYCSAQQYRVGYLQLVALIRHHDRVEQIYLDHLPLEAGMYVVRREVLVGRAEGPLVRHLPVEHPHHVAHPDEVRRYYENTGE